MAKEKLFGMKPENGRWCFVLVGLVANLCLGSVYAYGVFKPVIEVKYKLDAFQSNLPFMIFLAFFAVLMFFGGKLLEKFGPRKIGIVGGIIVAVGWALSYFTNDIMMLILTYGVIAGSGVGLAYGGPIAVSARWFPDKKGIAVGLTVAGFGGSAFITAKIADILFLSRAVKNLGFTDSIISQGKIVVDKVNAQTLGALKATLSGVHGSVLKIFDNNALLANKAISDLAVFKSELVKSPKFNKLVLNAVKTFGLGDTFLIFGLVFFVLLILLSLMLKFPVSGWKPEGWRPASGSAASGRDFVTAEIPKTSTFWGLFFCFTIGSVAGLMAIGISSSVGQEIIQIPAALATTLTGVFAIFNAAGRPVYGWLTDKVTPRWAAVINLSAILAVSVGMLFATKGNVPLYVVCFIIFWMSLGGWLAIAPTSTATFFGLKNYARNYGVVFFAYGLGAIIGGIISGQAKNLFGSYTFAFYPTAGLALLGVILALIFIRPPKKA